MYRYLLVTLDTDRKTGNGVAIPKGSRIAYHLQYASKTEILAHIIYANRSGRVEGIFGPKEPAIMELEKKEGHWVLPASEPAIYPIRWIKSQPIMTIRNGRKLVKQLKALHCKLLPACPERSRKAAKEYWQKRNYLQ